MHGGALWPEIKLCLSFFQANNLEILSENLKKDNEDLKAKLSSLVDKMKEVGEGFCETLIV